MLGFVRLDLLWFFNKRIRERFLRRVSLEKMAMLLLLLQSLNRKHFITEIRANLSKVIRMDIIVLSFCM
jgi:hypothetical protein